MLLHPTTLAALQRDNAFDYIRYLFALSLVAFHYCILSGRTEGWWIDGRAVVEAFFIMSGALVTLSLETRPDLRRYADRRWRRIFPAYVTAVALGFAAGAMMTVLPITDFLRQGDTWRYLSANLLTLNFLQPTLPGVFTHQPAAEVNGSLWIVKVELLCYLLAPLTLAALRRTGRRWPIILVPAGLYALSAIMPPGAAHLARTLIFFFLGMTMTLGFAAMQRHRRSISFAAAGIYAVYLAIGDEALLSLTGRPTYDTAYHLLLPACFAILLMYAAYGIRPLCRRPMRNNVSYGIFLYHFPIIQMTVAAGWAARYPVATFLLVMATTVAVALASWRLIERPLLRGGGRGSEDEKRRTR